MRTRGKGRAPQQERTRVPAPTPITHIAAPTREERLDLALCTSHDDEGTYLVMSIDLPVSPASAYEAWLGYEQVPCFMKGENGCERFDGACMTWRVQTVFGQFAWQAKTCVQVPFDHIAWKSKAGMPHPNFGSVSFINQGEHRSRVLIQLGFVMDEVCGGLGDPVPSVARIMERCLRRFYEKTANS